MDYGFACILVWYVCFVVEQRVAANLLGPRVAFHKLKSLAKDFLLIQYTFIQRKFSILSWRGVFCVKR